MQSTNMFRDDYIKSAHHPNIMVGVSVELEDNLQLPGGIKG